MKQRLITAGVLLCVLALVLLTSGTVAFPFVASFFCAFAVFEMQRCLGTHKKPQIMLPSMLLAIALPLCTLFAAGTEGLMMKTATVNARAMYLLSVRRCGVQRPQSAFFRGSGCVSDYLLHHHGICCHSARPLRYERRVLLSALLSWTLDHRFLCLLYRCLFRASQADTGDQPQKDHRGKHWRHRLLCDILYCFWHSCRRHIA